MVERMRPAGEDDLSLGREATSTVEAPKDINVRIAQLGREVVPISGPPGMTVGQALSKAQMALPDGLQLRVNNSTADLDHVLKDGEIIMLIPRIRGGTDEVEELVITVSNSAGELSAVLWFN